MTFLASNLDSLSLADAGLIAGLGYGLVFVGLISLMLVVILIGKAFSRKNAAQAPAAQPAQEVVSITAEEVSIPEAPGTAGHLKIYNVPPKTAAMLMAIVADKMGKPLNQLRFISIKEVE